MMDRDDLELFTRTLAHVTENNTGPALDAALSDLGWHDALASDRQAAVATLFDLQGRANATSCALAAVLLDGLGQGARSPHVVLPALGATDGPGTIEGDQVIVRGLATRSTLEAPTVVVVAAEGFGHVAIDLPTSALTVRTIVGLDPNLGLVEVHGRGRLSDTTPVDWTTAVRDAQLAISHELIGASATVLEMARQHALERIQFGSPIAGFQAVRHRLADALVAIETAAAMLDAAWTDGDSATTAMAKALAGRSARTTARHAQQVLAGIGFTLEHQFHHFFRRILLLDELMGSARQLTKELGLRLIDTRQLPPVPHL